MAKSKNKISIVNQYTASIDIGSRKIFIGLHDKPVKSFDTFTDDFLDAVNYLKENNISSVAMEATGVYWISLYDILDQSGFNVILAKSHNRNSVLCIGNDNQPQYNFCAGVDPIYAPGNMAGKTIHVNYDYSRCALDYLEI